MAVYHVRIMKGGGYSVQVEMGNGRVKEVSGRYIAKDKAELRSATVGLAGLVREARAGRLKLRGAQVYRGEEK